MTQSRTRIVLSLAAALALGGCLNLGGPPPPDRLMRLLPESPLPSETSRTASATQAVTVVVPTVPQELATVRVPVIQGGVSVAYLKDAQWIEPPNALFARLLSETIAATTGRVVLDPRQFAFDPGTRLTGQITAFGLDADAMEVVVRYDAALATGADSVQTRRFEARIPVAEANVTLVSPALNQAANRVAAEVARWIGN